MRQQRQSINIGQRFGNLTTVEIVSNGKYGKIWRCVCDCGNLTEVVGANLNRGHTRSCGCYGRNVAKKYVVDEDYFYVIDTEQKAYWLGFLYADGNIGKDLKTVRLVLQKRDMEHIQKFLYSINSSHPISYYKEQYPGVSIKNQMFCGGLIKSGLFPNKSRDITPPSLSDDLQRHFWRGVMDGDGSIRTSKVHAFALYGNRYTCLGFGDFLRKNTIMTNAKVTTNQFGVSSFSTSGRRVTFETLELLYGNSNVYLDRKYNRYLQISMGEI